jgi:hypothetical protein
MTWSVTNTIAYTSDASNHTAMVYLFDTVLAGKTGWTIQAHPDNSAFKRRAKFTTTNKVTGANYTIYSWVSWGSTSPNNLTWYEDATYTTTPGDLATNTLNLISSTSSGLNWSISGEDWRFCTSNENPQSVLVLKGAKAVFYWPGITSGVFWYDNSWAAGTSNKGTWISPFTGANSLWVANAPMSVNTNSNEYVLMPDAGWGPSATAGGYRIGGNYIATNFNWLYTNSTGNATLSNNSHTAFANGGHNDVGVWLPSSIRDNVDTRNAFSPNAGLTLQVGSSYWYSSYADLTYQGLVFNFGATDPLA